MRKRLWLCIAAAATAAWLAVPASASTGSPASGTFTSLKATITSSRSVGGNTFVTASRTAALAGTFTGPATEEDTIAVHSDGTTIVHGQGTCVLAAVQGERHRAGCVVAGERGFGDGSGCGRVVCDDTVSMSDKGRPSPLPFPEARGGP